MDIERLRADSDYQAAKKRAWADGERYDIAIADATERLTCADLLDRLGCPALDPEPHNVHKAANKRAKAAARSARTAVLREVCREFGLTYPSAPEGAQTRLLEQLRERFEGHAQAVAAAHEQRDLANKRAEESQKVAQTWFEDALALRKQLDEAERIKLRAIEDMRAALQQRNEVAAELATLRSGDAKPEPVALDNELARRI